MILNPPEGLLRNCLYFGLNPILAIAYEPPDKSGDNQGLFFFINYFDCQCVDSEKSNQRLQRGTKKEPKTTVMPTYLLPRFRKIFMLPILGHTTI